MRSVAVHMTDSSKVAELRRLVFHQTREMAWDENDSARAALLSTELATNLLKHAQMGVVAVNVFQTPAGGSRLQLVGIDRGPGLVHPERCFEDGYSTAGSSGTGLGALRRMSNGLEIFSTPGKGTVLLVEAWPAGSTLGTFSTGGVCIPRQGEDANGDAWDYIETDRELIVIVCDGLGHGLLAAQASEQALRAFRDRVGSETKELIDHVHALLRPTRGAAAAIAAIDRQSGTLRYCGVGNVTGVVAQGTEVRHLVSHNGILGHSVARSAEFVYPWNANSVLVMHTDGISARWNAEQWPGLWVRSPAVISGILYRDCARGRDDAAAVVVKAAA